jgi:Zn-dependent protease with chaperone function
MTMDNPLDVEPIAVSKKGKESFDEKVNAMKSGFAELLKAAGLPSLNIKPMRDIGINAAAFKKRKSPFFSTHTDLPGVSLSIGALLALTHNELMAVLAHEVSHIVNGDVETDPHDPDDSKEREFKADIGAIKLTKDKASLISALRKTIYINGVPDEESFSHPSLTERIRRIEAMEV